MSFGNPDHYKMKKNIFLAFLFFFMLVGTGRLNVDSFYSYLTARSIIKTGSLDVSKEINSGILNDKMLPHSKRYLHMATKANASGKIYSKYGVLWAICLVPFSLIGDVISKFVSLQSDLINIFIVSMAGPFLSSIVATLFFLVLKRLKIHSISSIYALVIFSIGSVNVYYSRGPYVETLDTALLLIIFLILQRIKSEKRKTDLFLIGIVLGFLFLTKIYNIVLAFPVILSCWFVFFFEFKWGPKEILYETIKIGIPIVLFVLVVVFLNFERFGNYFSGGYRAQVQFIPIYEGVYGILFSPGKSVFLLNPGILISVFGLITMTQRNLTECVFIVSTTLTYILFIANFPNWMAGPWGTRYLLPCICILHIPLAFVIDKIFLKKNNNLKKIGCISCFVFAFLINFPNLFIDQQKWNLLGERENIFNRIDLTYDASFSPILGSWRLFLSSLNSGICGEGESNKVSFEINDDKIGNYKDKALSFSLSGYDEWNTWFATIFRGYVTRYDKSKTVLPISENIKYVAVIVFCILLILSSLFIFMVFTNKE